jgi:hypothetical protein
MNTALDKIWNDPKRLREWTIEQLYLTDLGDLPWVYPVDRPERHSPHQQYLGSREINEQIRDGLLRCKHEDPEMFVRILNRSPFLAHLMRKRKRGRPRGHTPGLAEAWDEVGRIRRLWQRTFGKRYRSQSPTAIEIAASRHSFEPHEMENYNKNRSKRRSR